MEEIKFDTTSVPEKQISSTELLKLENQHSNGSNWFLWIAGLSLINSAIIIFGGSWNFIVGLAATQVVDGFVSAISAEIPNTFATIVKLVGLGLVISIAGLFALFGILARKKHQWAFIIGMILYALDGLIFLLVGDILSVAFHAFALLGLFGGLHALRKLLAVNSGTYVISDEVVEPFQIKKKTPRDQKYWLKLLVPAIILLIPLLLFLVMFFFFMD